MLEVQCSMFDVHFFVDSWYETNPGQRIGLCLPRRSLSEDGCRPKSEVHIDLNPAGAVAGPTLELQNMATRTRTLELINL